jgi:hypothetical protein
VSAASTLRPGQLEAERPHGALASNSVQLKSMESLFPMENPHAALSREHLERLKQEQQFARQIMFVADQAFADRTEIPGVSDLRAPEARHSDQAKNGFVRPLPWDCLFQQAAE